ncbi:hypothetical protein GH714_027480 [Hevea brasiliensis]|uniref:DUF8040 domain-containing protein n=1 Tax=Hevea brasiliensis TaxID=3981 RepID=A0A6A6NDK1_HEVBR|nr:hypothetical protein GH714_027480 [Hevea brasiliensis]
MSQTTFTGLCEILVKDGGLRPTLRTTIEEQVVKSLYLLAHSVTNHKLAVFFCRSGETTSHHFHNVLRAILELEDKFLKQPDGSQVPSEMLNNNRFYPFFKDCVGAIDGTHIHVKVSPLEAPKYRGKYNLVDTGFMLRSGLIIPYREERYHLKEYSRNPPRNAGELFNLRHASLRNAIE